MTLKRFLESFLTFFCNFNLIALYRFFIYLRVCFDRRQYISRVYFESSFFSESTGLMAVGLVFNSGKLCLDASLFALNTFRVLNGPNALQSELVITVEMLSRD